MENDQAEGEINKAQPIDRKWLWFGKTLINEDETWKKNQQQQQKQQQSAKTDVYDEKTKKKR